MVDRSQIGSLPSTRAWPILVGLLLGVGCGLFFGDLCGNLSIVGDAFIGLLRMSVLPYIAASLIANLGRLSLRASRRLALIGGLVMMVLWTLGLIGVAVMPYSFPEWKAGSFFSVVGMEPPAKVDLVDYFIPANVFRALAEDQVPAVVLICVLVGLTLSQIEGRESVIQFMDVLAKVFMRISGWVTRLAPVGIFAIAATTAGTMSFEEIARLKAYLLAYTLGTIMLAFVVLPLLVTTCTTFTYREVFSVAKTPMLAAFATGKLIVVLPILIEKTEALFAKKLRDDRLTAPAVDVLYPVVYPFPHVGKLLAMLFIPFAAWFLGNAMEPAEYPTFLLGGLFAYFGGPLLATPYLLDQMQLPHDMFELFLLSGVYCERLGDAIGAMHLLVFTLITTSAFAGSLTFRMVPIIKYAMVVMILSVVSVGGLRALLADVVPGAEARHELIARSQTLHQTAQADIVKPARSNPDPLLPGETLLDRIRRRRTIRIGYNEDNRPFAFVGVNCDLVGYDIELAHALARDLGVRIEFVPFGNETLRQQLEDDDFDVVMSGLVGTIERAETMLHTSPYLEVTLALLVHDHQVRGFQSVDSLRRLGPVRIGFDDVGQGFVDRVGRTLPEAVLIKLPSKRAFLEDDRTTIDAVLTSAEGGSAYTLVYPDFEVVVPRGLEVSVPLFYVVGANDTQMRDFLEHWIGLRRNDGTLDHCYQHWVLGRLSGDQPRRWCIARDVLGWIE